MVEINDGLGDSPELVNSDPFGDGWIFVLKIDDGAELKNLNDAAGYRAQIG